MGYWENARDMLFVQTTSSCGVCVCVCMFVNDERPLQNKIGLHSTQKKYFPMASSPLVRCQYMEFSVQFSMIRSHSIHSFFWAVNANVISRNSAKLAIASSLHCFVLHHNFRSPLDNYCYNTQHTYRWNYSTRSSTLWGSSQCCRLYCIKPVLCYSQFYTYKMYTMY